MARVALEHVDKTYPNGYIAARDLSLEAADGELLVLVGPSGSGKSTVLRLMAGLERVSDGVIRIGERDVTDLPPQQRDIAMVFQNYALYPHMTVRENLGFGLSIRKQPGRSSTIVFALSPLPSDWMRCSIESRRSSQAVSGSASHSGAPSFASRWRFSSTSRCRISMRSFEWRPASSWLASIAVSRQRWFTSLTINRKL